jgi:hypothetical protein
MLKPLRATAARAGGRFAGGPAATRGKAGAAAPPAPALTSVVPVSSSTSCFLRCANSASDRSPRFLSSARSLRRRHTSLSLASPGPSGDGACSACACACACGTSGTGAASLCARSRSRSWSDAPASEGGGGWGWGWGACACAASGSRSGLLGSSNTSALGGTQSASNEPCEDDPPGRAAASLSRECEDATLAMLARRAGRGASAGGCAGGAPCSGCSLQNAQERRRRRALEPKSDTPTEPVIQSFRRVHPRDGGRARDFASHGPTDIHHPGVRAAAFRCSLFHSYAAPDAEMSKACLSST